MDQALFEAVQALKLKISGVADTQKLMQEQHAQQQQLSRQQHELMVRIQAHQQRPTPVKVRDPSTFDGSPGTLHSWVNEINTYVNYHGMKPTDQQTGAFAGMYLKNAAKEYYAAMTAIKAPTWDELSRALVEAFEAAGTVEHYLNQLDNIRMTSTVDEYVSRFLATQANLPDSACATPSRIHFFKKGLNDHMRKAFAYTQPKTLMEAISLLMVFRNANVQEQQPVQQHVQQQHQQQMEVDAMQFGGRGRGSRTRAWGPRGTSAELGSPTRPRF